MDTFDFLDDLFSNFYNAPKIDTSAKHLNWYKMKDGAYQATINIPGIDHPDVKVKDEYITINGENEIAGKKYTESLNVRLPISASSIQSVDYYTKAGILILLVKPKKPATETIKINNLDGKITTASNAGVANLAP